MSEYFLTDLERFAGPNRVVIDKVIPSVDDGAFPIKRADGDPLCVRAHVFADGHDTVVAVLQYRQRGDSVWQEVPMEPLGNDEWEATIRLMGIGFHEYRVVGWVDHFRFWREGFGKKQAEGQDMKVELLIGANLVEEAASRAEDGDRQRLLDAADALRDEVADLNQRISLAQSQTLYDLAVAYSDRSRQTCSANHPVLVERERAIFSAWYEFFPRSWGKEGKHGTFKTAQEILPEIARMNFDVVYLPPIHPIGRKFRKGVNNALQCQPGDVGSPWAVGSDEGGHKAVHPDLGTLQDFRDFVWRCGELGMEVALDIAFQCAPDHPYVKEHPQWFNWRPDGTVQYAENPPKKYQDILPFNFECDDWQSLWEELKSIFIFWIEQGVKIFRVDNPHTKPFEFWRWCITEIKKEHPDVIFLAEAFTRPKRKYRLAKGGFTQGYTYFTWRNSRDELRSYVEELAHTEVAEYFWPNFWPNTPDILHDYIVHGGRNASICRLVLAATLSSNWGQYGPAFELIETEPFPGKEEYNHNEKYQLKNWDWDRPGNIKHLIARVNYIRKTNPALRRTRNIQFVDTDNPALIAYVKQTSDRSNQILTVVNFDPRHTQSGWLQLPLWHMGISDHDSYRVRDLFAQDLDDGSTHVYTWTGRSNFVSLRPGSRQAHIFRIERI